MFQEILFKRSLKVGIENLKLCRNLLYWHFSEIKQLQKLEFLKFDRNSLTTIPNEIAERKLNKSVFLELQNHFLNFRSIFLVSSIENMSFDECSQLCFIPNNLLMMENLINLSFKRCSISKIPSMVSTKLKNLCFTGNPSLTCVPHEVMKFVDPLLHMAEFYMVSDVKRLFMFCFAFLDFSAL